MTMVNIYETCDIFLKDYSKKKVLHVSVLLLTY